MLLEEFRHVFARAVIYACGGFYVNRVSLVCESVLGRCTDRRFDNFSIRSFTLTFMTSKRSAQSEVQDRRHSWARSFCYPGDS